MALTDLLKGVRKGARKAALGLALAVGPMYGCGGGESPSGNTPKEPTYEGMCEDWRNMVLEYEANTEYGNEELYVWCLESCEPKVNNEKYKRDCANVYCEIQLGEPCENFNASHAPAYNKCMESFDVEPYTFCPGCSC